MCLLLQIETDIIQLLLGGVLSKKRWRTLGQSSHLKVQAAAKSACVWTASAPQQNTELIAGQQFSRSVDFYLVPGNPLLFSQQTRETRISSFAFMPHQLGLKILNSNFGPKWAPNPNESLTAKKSMNSSHLRRRRDQVQFGRPPWGHVMLRAQMRLSHILPLLSSLLLPIHAGPNYEG